MSSSIQKIVRALVVILIAGLFTSSIALPARAATLDKPTPGGAIVTFDMIQSATPIKFEFKFEPGVNYDEVKLLPSIPLAATIQKQIFLDVCQGNVEQFIMLMAVAKQESRSFNVTAIGDNGNAYGLFQIWPLWHWARMNRLGIYSAEELFDPVKCARVALDYLEWIKSSRGLTAMDHSVYVIYNAGHYTTNSVVSARATNVMNYYHAFMTEFAASNPALT